MALGDALNIGAAAVEELGPETETDRPATIAQLRQLAAAGKAAGLDGETIAARAQARFSRNPRELTGSEVAQLTREISAAPAA